MAEQKFDALEALVPRKDIMSALSDVGAPELSEKILSYLDGPSLAKAESVCNKWAELIFESDGILWRSLLERKLKSDPLWKKLSFENQCIKDGFNPSFFGSNHCGRYRDLYCSAAKRLQHLDQNWKTGNCKTRAILLENNNRNPILQITDDKIACTYGGSGSTIKVWDKRSLACISTIDSPDPVYSFQLSDDFVIAGFDSISLVRVWNVKNAVLVNTFQHPVGPQRPYGIYLNLYKTLLLTHDIASDIVAWDISPKGAICFKRCLSSTFPPGFRLLELDESFILCASFRGKFIDVWSFSTCEYVRRIEGPIKMLKLMKYQYPFVITCDDVQAWVFCFQQSAEAEKFQFLVFQEIGAFKYVSAFL